MKPAMLATAFWLMSRAATAQVLTPVPPNPPPAAPPVVAIKLDSIMLVVRRAQRLVTDGSGADGRTLLDSLLERTESRSAQEAEVLFWRATLAESWDVAQRDYLRLMLEHEGRPRAADAMLRLAQGEVARGDRAAALRYLERLAREAPESAARAEAGLWQGRLLLERGSRADGCRVLRDARGRVVAGAIELENQYEFLLRGCPAEAAPPPVSAPTPPAPPPPAVTPPGAARSAVAGALVWSVQVAAFGTSAEAAGFADEVRTLGFDARVDGAVAPFRVRFGRFATRAEAQTAMMAYRTKARADAFLTEVPRE